MINMAYQPKVYLGIITQNDEQNLIELCQPLKHISGIFGVVHQPSNDKSYEVLEANKGSGDIIKLPYLQRHDWSMNGFLFNPKFMRGSWCLLADSLERYSEQFLSQIRSFICQLEQNNIEYVYQYSKLMLFKKKDEHFFFGSPHWGLANREGNSIRIEQYIPDDKQVRWSVRNEKRAKDEYISHFMVYWFHAGFSNHLLLGNEDNLNKYRILENIRREFLTFCSQELKIDLTVEAFKNYILKNGLNYDLKFYINEVEILNSWYCYEILGHKFEDIDLRRTNKQFFKIN